MSNVNKKHIFRRPLFIVFIYELIYLRKETGIISLIKSNQPINYLNFLFNELDYLTWIIS